ncbi:PAS domain-containing sensor histidine kinase [Altererythrobacter sp. Root672]|uniref:hybrid sensor histidine kinase/response regulator n=1 Tax=Altererythrobacter sp. Root672 TaxID=1736584 RepID=UPI0006F9A118|nr:PAS domain-containing sensor histidine kinase [Altererythrobacter sp. Root672]KRA83089.1 histidine kinase [Altererythrobacter sp. Root672]
MSVKSLNSGRADLLVQSITDYAIYMLDPSGIVSSWNAGAERLKGYRPSEIIGQHFAQFYTEEDLASGIPAKALKTSLEEGRFEAEGWRLRKDGSRFWANVVIDPIRDEQGTHVGFAKITRDLTEHRASEEALRQSEERFRLLVQSVTDYAIYMLDPDGKVSSWNAGAQRFKGYQECEIIGEHFSRFYLPEDRAAGIPDRALKTAAGEGRFEAEGWRLRKDGSRFWAHVVIDPIHDGGATLIGFTKITRDLTERKRAQEALQKSQEQFFQAQKMEAIGKLTGGVAHDFNNILAAILGSLSLAKRRLADGADIDRFLENAMTAAERGATLSQRMLAFARKQELSLEAVDLQDAVRSMAEILQRTIGPGITIRTDFPLSLPPALADRTQLELAVMNLVVNARDALPEGGEVIISAEEAFLPDTVGAYVRLSVIDPGDGMSAGTLARATEPFFTTKGVGKGTGLGLSMVQGMVEQCGGRLLIESVPGKGTKVEILLPVAEVSAATAVTPEADGEQASPTGALRILAVDDDEIVLLNTATMLSDMGHQVLQADSGPSALRVIASEDLDLMVTDYAMPDMSGGELVEKAREIRPDLKVIVVSGFADLPDGEELGLPRLSKPFTEVELAKTISQIA